jgi:hypothetical protein
VDRGDIATILVAAATIIVIVWVLSHGIRTDTAPLPPTPTPPVTRTTLPAVPVSPTPGTTPLAITPYRITYTGQYSSYPVLYLPSDMSSYGASDPVWRFNSSVRFAYLDESHGGLTTTFTVPYPVWRLNCTVSAWRSPEKAHLRLLLVDAETGANIEGMEWRYPGSIVKNVQTRFRPLYMVVSTEYVDRVMISLETPTEFL